MPGFSSWTSPCKDKTDTQEEKNRKCSPALWGKLTKSGKKLSAKELDFLRRTHPKFRTALRPTAAQ